MLNYFPKYFTTKAIALYFIALLAVSVMFVRYSMSWYWYVFGIISVASFFYFSNSLTKKWTKYSAKFFAKKLFYTALIIRLVWVLFSYGFYSLMTGQPFEFSAADSLAYNAGSRVLADTWFENYEITLWGLNFSDYGYYFYLGFIYLLTGKSILAARIIKALLSAFTVVLIYRFASRSIDEKTGRMAAIFCMLMPNLIYYCGLHLKETEMLFLTVAFIERADYAMRSAKFSFSNIILPILLAGTLFLFRTVLGAAALFAFFTALMLSSSRTLKKGGRRIILIAWVGLVIVYFMGGRIATEVEEVWEARGANQQQSMEWRAQRKGGNEFARYASGVMFAPLITVIPFPTMVEIPVQQNQQMLHGGYYVKNAIGFFILFALFWFVKGGKWRDNVLILSFTFGYLIVIAFSAFAHSERFHLPALPFLLILSALGVSQQTNKTKKYYIWWLAFVFIAILGWSWFKLAGRGWV